MKHEKSCGLIVFYRDDDGLNYLLLHYPEGHWDLPKGHVEVDEGEKETALRELYEETGIKNVKFIEDFREKIHYFFKSEDELISKTVVFFLAEAKEKAIELSHEHKNFTWLEYEKAHEKLTFKNVKDLLKKAQNFVKG